MNQQQRNRDDSMFPGDTMHDDYVADERDHIGGDEALEPDCDPDAIYCQLCNSWQCDCDPRVLARRQEFQAVAS